MTQKEETIAVNGFHRAVITAVVKTMTKWLLVTGFTLVLTAMGFYYDTQHNIAVLEEKQSITDDCIQRIDTKLTEMPSMHQYNRDLDEIKSLLIRLDDKIDRLKVAK